MLYEQPDEQQARRELAPLVSALHRILPRVATERVIPYFEAAGLAVDDTLATHMTRFETRRALGQEGIDAYYDEDSYVEDEPPPPVDLKQLNLSGIEGTYGGWPFKILRSRNGEVPPPGGSHRRRQFYCQIQRLRLPGFDEAPRPARNRPNVVILWDHDTEYRRFQISIAVPEHTNGAYGRVDCYFNVVVPPSFDPAITSIVNCALSDQPQEPELTPKDVDLDDIDQKELLEEGLAQIDFTK